MIYVGTSGFSFRDWVGPFYPEGTRSEEMLARYSRVFPAVEINVTYYRLPSADTFRRMARVTPPGFRFVVKLTGSLTHPEPAPPAAAGSSEGSGGDRRHGELPGPAPAEGHRSLAEECAAFVDALAPLRESNRLDGVLAQFPYRFREGPGGRDHIRALRQHLPETPLFVEFRHASWDRETTYRLLSELDVGFCVVDEPRLPGLFPPVVRQTTDVAYFRFHGRNAERWWDGDSSTRYDYLYTENELREWARRIHDTAARTRQTFVFFNNCHGGSAPRNAEQMQAILGSLHSDSR